MNIINSKYFRYLEEIDDILNINEARMAYKDQVIEESKKAMAEKDKVMAEKDKAIQEEKQQKRLVQLQLAKILLQQNTPIAEVAKIAGLTATEIKNLTNK